MTKDFLQEKLEKRSETGLLRQLTVVEGGTDFSSNDYLGFARRAEFWEPQPLSRYGAAGSRLLTGNTRMTEETEAEIAVFHQAQAGLIYNSGYDANTGLFSCIAGKDDTILYDEWIHASIRDGVRLSLASHYSFRHNDLDHLEEKIKRATGRVFVAIESVYSMDGDLAPLRQLVSLKQKYPHVHLVVDEAHATGVFGPNGAGMVQELGLQKEFFARVHTFGKALGCFGAVVLGSAMLRSYLINFSRPFIYTTALPMPNIIAIKMAYRALGNANGLMNALHQNIHDFNVIASEYSLPAWRQSISPIHVLLVPGNEAAKKTALSLRAQGFDVRAVLSPTVPAGSERLRICLHAFNTKKEIEDMVSLYASVSSGIQTTKTSGK